MTRHRKLGIAVLAVVAFVATSAGSAAANGAKQSGTEAGPIDEGDYCYTFALTDDEMDAGATSVLHCYATERELKAAQPGGAAASGGGFSMLSFSYRVIGRHYDSSYGFGAYLNVYGTDCGGGGVSLSGGSWDDRISSTLHGPCYTISHYANGGYGGGSSSTSGGCWNLRLVNATLNNNVSSIKYFGPEDGSCSI